MRRRTAIMKNRQTRLMDDLAKEVGAIGWSIVRENKHLVIDFYLDGGGVVRQVLAATGSDRRVDRNVKTQLRRSMREALGC